MFLYTFCHPLSLNYVFRTFIFNVIMDGQHGNTLHSPCLQHLEGEVRGTTQCKVGMINTLPTVSLNAVPGREEK